MKTYCIKVLPKADESLSPLVVEIKNKFPDIDNYTSDFIIKEKRKGFFSSGYPKILKVEIKFHLEDDQVPAEALELVDFIKGLDIGDADFEIVDEE
ncbi:hypothetical protein [Alteromonas sp. a30]|uniref:hypothetical protein n=1 Tax=Alteromonas sp. a30 TaxID=2730917 RepID=UPI00228062DB|nr:hypothetical protein [Alteromonas sp. a30]MCY7297297.1 hypothetical protein [Alteromonas sp. a30]